MNHSAATTNIEGSLIIYMVYVVRTLDTIAGHHVGVTVAVHGIIVIVTLCISEVSCRRVGEAVALRASVPLTGEFRLT